MTGPDRWTIVAVFLDPARGREQAGNRPALVVSDSTFNQVMDVITILPITTWREGRTIYPNELMLEAGTGGLPSRSIVMAHQIRTISTDRIKRVYGSLDDPDLRRACERAISVHLGMY